VEIGRRLLPVFPRLTFREISQTWKHLLHSVFTAPPSTALQTAMSAFGETLRPKADISPCFKGGPRTTLDLRRRTEIMPIKGPYQNKAVCFDQRPRPLYIRCDMNRSRSENQGPLSKRIKIIATPRVARACRSGAFSFSFPCGLVAERSKNFFQTPPPPPSPRPWDRKLNCPPPSKACSSGKKKKPLGARWGPCKGKWALAL
jgi:hypothetical protein